MYDVKSKCVVGFGFYGNKLICEMFCLVFMNINYDNFGILFLCFLGDGNLVYICVDCVDFLKNK